MKIQCPSEMWDDYMTQQERAAAPSNAEALEALDAYGHMTYTFGYGEEGDERGDWLACLDFKVFDCDGVICIAVHAIVNSESGGFIETILEEVFEGKEGAEGVPEQILNTGLSYGDYWTDLEVKGALDCAKKWREDLAKALQLARCKQ